MPMMKLSDLPQKSRNRPNLSTASRKIQRACFPGRYECFGRTETAFVYRPCNCQKPKIYLFDDSFSALDFKTDVKLRKALADNIHDCTIIIVAQRISTILNADKIVVLDEGRIAGIGTHSELMKSCEVYRQIAHSQLSQKDLAAIDNAKGGAVNA